jgi:hypothetical protein
LLLRSTAKPEYQTGLGSASGLPKYFGKMENLPVTKVFAPQGSTVGIKKAGMKMPGV